MRVPTRVPLRVLSLRLGDVWLGVQGLVNCGRAVLDPMNQKALTPTQGGKECFQTVWSVYHLL